MYQPPNCRNVGGNLFNDIFDTSFDEQMKSLLQELGVFGLSMFCTRATIKKTPPINVLGDGLNSPFALINIVNCMAQMQQGGKKTAGTIAGLMKPTICPRPYGLLRPFMAVTKKERKNL
jgi:hypothetical protein